MIAHQNIKRFSLLGRMSHNKTFGAPISMPETLGRAPQYIRQQGPTNYCTAASRSSAGSYLFGKDMSFEYQTAKEGEEAGAPIYYGADPNQADQAIEDYGFLPSLMAPFSFQYDGWLKPADWHNYDPKLDGDAILSRAQGYNVYPDYDSIKQALVAGMADNAIVVPNGFWYSNWTPDINGILPMPNGSPISRHSYMFIDYKTINGTEYLVAQLSEGKQWGVGGTCYMSKECVNTAFASPLWNGLGCTIYRKSPATAITVKISIMQKLLVKLLELKDLLMGNI